MWQGCSSLREASRKLGIKRAVLKNRARRYRANGVLLKQLDEEPTEWVDWDEVREFAASFLEKKSAEVAS